MKIVNPNQTTHNIKFIPREYTGQSLNVMLFDESLNKYYPNIPNISNTIDGITNLDFDFDFLEGYKYQLTISNADNTILFRGKIFATNKDVQELKQSDGEYIYYE